MIRLIFYFITTILFAGCGLLKQSREPDSFSEFRKDHRDPHHIFSCGPEALEKAFKQLNIYIDKEDISHSIQKDNKFNTCVRDVLSIFVNSARKITFPAEMIKVLKTEGYSVKEVKKYSDLNETTDVAIILIKQKNTLNYHWICFPVDKNILSFFGKDTVLKEIYLISK
jgi:hypothetical protein